jgi:hypothetical protein
MTIDFTKRIENFTCEHCGAPVTGNGFTNHCPQCLWSKHVDITPGDRASECGGMMEPISIETKHDETIITHRCVVCGYEKRNKSAENDSQEEILKVTSENAFRTR